MFGTGNTIKKTEKTLKKIKNDIYPEYRYAVTDFYTGGFLYATKTFDKAMEDNFERMVIITDLNSV